MKDFKIRCSQIGKLMGAKGLGKTGESYLETWLKEQVYNRRKEFTSKYTNKGNEMEDNNIDFVADVLGFGMLVKNEQYFENDFLTGTPDIILPNEIIDIKSSWDCFTFPLYDYELENKDYYWQMQGYMSLTGKSAAKVIYVLSDTPQHMIQKEAYWYCKQNGYEDLDIEIYNDFLKKMTYKDIPNELKIKTFVVERSETDIQLIYNRVVESRIFINKIKS